MQEFTLNDKRAERIVTILRQLLVHDSLDVEQAAAELATSARTIRNDVDLLVEKGWVESSGSTKGKNYKLTTAGRVWVSRRLRFFRIK